jgi:hypothetical protein
VTRARVKMLGLIEPSVTILAFAWGTRLFSRAFCSHSYPFVYRFLVSGVVLTYLHHRLCSRLNPPSLLLIVFLLSVPPSAVNEEGPALPCLPSMDLFLVGSLSLDLWWMGLRFPDVPSLDLVWLGHLSASLRSLDLHPLGFASLGLLFPSL